jgi:hypothetical protein
MQPQASLHSAPIPSPESSSGISRFRISSLRLHAQADQPGQGQVAPAARQGLEATGVIGGVDLQTSLALGSYLAEHRHKELLIHPLEQLQDLEAVANGVLPQAFGLILNTQIAAGYAHLNSLALFASSP